MTSTGRTQTALLPSNALTRTLVRPPRGLEHLELRLAILVAWTLAGVLDTAGTHGFYTATGQDHELAITILTSIPWWLSWAALTFAVVELTARLETHVESGLLKWSVHSLAALVVAVVHIVSVTTFLYLVYTRGMGRAYQPLVVQIFTYLTTYVVIDMVIYFAIVGGFHALLVFRTLQSKQSELHALERRAEQLEASATRARLEALRMELNPHFFFNTLNAISTLVQKGDLRRSRQGIARLASLLRLTLEEPGRELVTLDREIEFIEKYLELQQLRFGDRLETRYDIGPGTGRSLLPPLILQPLIENAVQYGVERAGEGRITIASRMRAGMLVVEIRNGSPGSPSPRSPTEGTGIGIRNVERRLTTVYGDRADVELELGEEGTATARLTVPQPPVADGGAASSLHAEGDLPERMFALDER